MLPVNHMYANNNCQELLLRRLSWKGFYFKLVAVQTSSVSGGIPITGVLMYMPQYMRRHISITVHDINIARLHST